MWTGVSLSFSSFTVLSLTLVAMQVASLSCHAASGIVAVGFAKGQIDLWQIEPYIAPHIPLPSQACVRERLAEAQAQVKMVDILLERADDGLRQQMMREQELKLSISDLEAECSYISNHVSV